MKNRWFGSVAARLVGVCAIGLGIAGTASPAVVNLDIEGGASDTTHSGADGVLSGGGTFWNGIDAGVDASGLLDETGAPTSTDVVWTSGGGGEDASSTNDLQDSGAFGTFEVQGLDPGTAYDVAIYAFPFSFIAFTDSSGPSGGLCSGSPTYALPGTQDADYCLYEDVMPADLGGGVYGFTISGLDGAVMGVQVSGPGGQEPPTVPALGWPGKLALGTFFLFAGVFALRSRAR